MAKLNEIEKQRSANVFQSTQTSLSDELEKVTVDEMKKKKIIDALTKLNELGEVRKKEILNLEKSLERLKVSRKMPTSNLPV